MLRRLMVGGVLVVTAFLALAPGAYSPLAPLADDWVPVLDHRHLVVAAHLVGYASLVVLVYWVTRHLALAVVGVLLFSTALELLQAWLPWRECSWADIQINLLAVALGWLVIRVGAKWWAQDGRG